MKKIVKYFSNMYDDLFFAISCFLCCLSISIIPLSSATASVAHYGAISIVVVWFIIKIILNIFEFIRNKNISKDICISFILLFISALVCITCSFIQGNNIFLNNDGLRFILLLFSCLILIFLVSFGKFSKFSIKIISLSILLYPICIALFLIFKCHFNIQEMINVYAGYSNPNILSIFSFTIGIIAMYFMISYRSIIVKIIYGFISVISIFLALIAGGRTPILGIGAAFLFFVVVLIFKKSIKSWWLALFLFVLPLIFACIYYALCAKYSNYLSYSQTDMVSGDKSILSRYKIYVDDFYHIFNSPLVGNCQIAGNAHNSLLTMIINYGFIGIIPIGLFFVFTIKKSIENSAIKLRSQYFALLILFYAVCTGFTESFPFYGSNASYVLMFSSIILIKIPLGKNLFEEKNLVKNKKNDIGGVLNINNVYEYGSTGLIVKNIHEYLISKNMKSKVIYGRNNHYNDVNIVCSESIYDVACTSLLRKIFKNDFIGAYSMTSEIIQCIKTIKPDIVHIHGLNDNYVNGKILLKFLAKNNIKTIFTNHSEWLYTGCSDDTNGCDKFATEGCLCCNKNKNTLLKHKYKKSYETKKKLLSFFRKDNLYFTNVSDWVFSRSIQSHYLNKFNSFLIRNGSDFYKYKDNNPYSKEEILKMIKNKTNYSYKNIALFVSTSLEIENKGYRFLEQIANANPDYLFLIICMSAGKVNIPKNAVVFENVKDKYLLYAFYQFSDILLTLSRHETFAYPVLEAIESGTYVCGFKSGGPDSYCPKELGTFYDYGDVKSINQKLKSLPKNRTKIRIDDFSINKMADEYYKLYQSLLTKYEI